MHVMACVSTHPRLRSDDSLPSGCAQSLDTHHTCPYGSMRAIALRSPLSLLLYPGGLTSGGVPGMMKTEMVQAFESREGSDWVLSLASPQEVRASRLHWAPQPNDAVFRGLRLQLRAMQDQRAILEMLVS